MSRVLRTSSLAATAVAALVLTACGSDGDGDAAPVAAAPTSDTAPSSAPSQGSSAPAPADGSDQTDQTDGSAATADGAVLAAASTAVAAVPGSTLFSVDREDAGTWEVTVVTEDGTENDVDVDEAGTTVVGGPRVDRDDADDADDLAERQQLLADATVDHEAAVRTAAAEAGAGSELTDLDLDLERGQAVWQVGFGDDTATEQTVLVDAVTGEVVGVDQDD
ncbi:PepSY domain-containing protein [Nocardioides litoris]|uniref:PepSY domain-containing protein n=1 Tax=Nocardioides litoris TaxID=1926648 RepID=UPI001124C85A|nr:PepSY domain-containing protein [Nocardioides litoris]